MKRAEAAKVGTQIALRQLREVRGASGPIVEGHLTLLSHPHALSSSPQPTSQNFFHSRHVEGPFEVSSPQNPSPMTTTDFRTSPAGVLPTSELWEAGERSGSTCAMEVAGSRDFVGALPSCQRPPSSTG